VSRFDERLRALDITLFDGIPSQSTGPDRRSLLAAQCAVRATVGSYVYLEIGSHLGGSVQTHVMDPACVRIYSIDRRPLAQPDARGQDSDYSGNSTARMLENLTRVAGDAVAKVVTFDADASAVPPASISPPPQLCFIDGEHTDRAFLSDFSFCRQVMGDRGLVVCHDGLVIYRGIAEAIASLERDGVRFDASPLADAHFAIDLGDTGILRGAELAPIVRDSYRAYLFALMANDGYRKFATRPIFKALRSMRDRATAKRSTTP
jgi:hypothetical protein